MCDPFTLIMGGLSALGSVMGATKKQPKPPEPAAPVVTQEARAPGAVVRLGAGKEDETTQNAPQGPVLGFTERRSKGSSLTRGRSGLVI